MQPIQYVRDVYGGKRYKRIAVFDKLEKKLLLLNYCKSDNKAKAVRKVLENLK